VKFYPVFDIKYYKQRNCLTRHEREVHSASLNLLPSLFFWFWDDLREVISFTFVVMFTLVTNQNVLVATHL